MGLHPTLPYPPPPPPRSIIKREVEERLGSHGEFGRVSFARLSFGRQPPVITGVKGVPLRDGEALAMGEGHMGGGLCEGFSRHVLWRRLCPPEQNTNVLVSYCWCRLCIRDDTAVHMASRSAAAGGLPVTRSV